MLIDPLTSGILGIKCLGSFLFRKWYGAFRGSGNVNC